jgi:CheY-like chemotaxis protein
MEMARIESGKIVLEEEVCKITDLLEQIVSVYSKLMEQKEIRFTTNLDIETEYYYGDKVKLSEIFLNIISNAYKYTEPGGKISLSLKELTCKEPEYIKIQTTITDTGIGMSEEYLPKIFEEFSREHTSTENRIEGTGLGMPIVKKLVELMNGTIEVESKLEEGTTFTVTIPHKIAEAQDIKMDTPLFVDRKKFKGKRILLVEDNELNREIATELLQEFGFFIEPAEDGLICIDMLTKAESDYYDLILMDVQMPNLDGYGATKKIRDMKDKTKANIPIIAMTANAFEEDRKDAIEAGMNGHLAKPIEMAKSIKIFILCRYIALYNVYKYLHCFPEDVHLHTHIKIGYSQDLLLIHPRSELRF